MDKTALCVKKKSESVLRGLKSPPSKKKNRNQLTNETNKTNHYNIYEQSLVPNDFVFCQHMGWVCALVHVMGIRVYTERPCGNQKFRCESQVVDYGLTDGFYIKSQGLSVGVEVLESHEQTESDSEMEGFFEVTSSEAESFMRMQNV